MKTVIRKAYAKINLALDVLGRRPDGYHDVCMIMQTIGLHDVLQFEQIEEKGIELVTGINEELPENRKENLVYRAASQVMEEYDLQEGIRITLQKNIPIAAGMAGGSTDAAAVYHGMKELFSLSMQEEDMCRLGVKLGADIPYCIMGGTALSEGIGEVLTKLPAPPFCYLVIAKPAVSVSTKYVYENLHVEKLLKHPDTMGMVQAIQEGNLTGVTERMENVLETVTEIKYPVIGQIKQCLLQMGAMNALMSGSGPTVFGVFEQETAAVEAAEEIQRRGLTMQTYVTTFHNEEK